MRITALVVAVAAGVTCSSTALADVLKADTPFGFQITAIEKDGDRFTAAHGTTTTAGGRYDSTNDYLFGDVKFTFEQTSGAEYHHLKITAKAKGGEFLKRDRHYNEFSGLEFNFGDVDGKPGLPFEDNFELVSGEVSVFSGSDLLALGDQGIGMDMDGTKFILTLVSESSKHYSLTDFWINKLVWDFKFKKTTPPPPPGNIIPLPSAAMLGMVGLGFVGARRRRA
ncbi:MAG: hypothetical protein AAGB51_11035 [Planctomycetota bacterium]